MTNDIQTQEKEIKIIQVSPQLHQKLNVIKATTNLKSFGGVVEELIKNSELLAQKDAEILALKEKLKEKKKNEKKR